MTCVSAEHYRKQNGLQNLSRVQQKHLSQHSYSADFIVLHVSPDVQRLQQAQNTGAVHSQNM
jgi:hypothetical protein